MDDSILNLGELSSVSVEEYLYSPEKQRSRSILRLIDGTLKAVVGRSDLEIHTPTAIVGSRGTKFILWIEGKGEEMRTGLIVLEGEVFVKNILEGIKGTENVTEDQITYIPMNKPPERIMTADPRIILKYTRATEVIGIIDRNVIKVLPKILAAGKANLLPPRYVLLKDRIKQQPVEALRAPVKVRVVFP